MSLIANIPVLYRSTQYRTGDKLPADNADMVAAWIDAGSARWENEAKPKAEEKPAVKKAAPKKSEKKG